MPTLLPNVRNGLAVVCGAIVAGVVSLVVAPDATLGTNAASASPTAPASLEITMPNGATWRGDLNDQVEVKYTENGVAQSSSGQLKKVDRLYITINTTIAGRTGDKVIFKSDLTGMKTVTGATASGDKPGADAGKTATTSAAATTTAGAAIAGATATYEKDGKTYLKAPKPGVFLLPLKGTVGIGLRHEEIEKICQEADKYGPGQIIVLEIDSPGGLVTEGDKINETFKKWKDRHRFVAWIREAISGAAFTALHCDEIVFMRVGSLGAITMFSGETSIQGERLQAWLDKCSEVAEFGGRNPIPVRAMIHAPLLCSYDKDEVTGKVTWYDTLQGAHVLSNEKDNLSFNATNGMDSGFIDGVADRTDELAKILQIPEWYEINDSGRKMAKDWQDTLEQCSREVPKLYVSYGMKGGDAEMVIGSQMIIIRDLIKWWDRCYNGMAYDLPQKGVSIPPKEDLERKLKDLQKQMADIKKQKRAAESN